MYSFLGHKHLLRGNNPMGKWVSDPSLVNGLATSTSPAPSVGWYNGELYCLLGQWGGNFYGYKWNGSSWSADEEPSDDIGSVSHPCLWENGTDSYCIGGAVSSDGVPYGWENRGYGWYTDAVAKAGISMPNDRGMFKVFDYNGSKYCIGMDSVTEWGYIWNSSTSNWDADTTFSENLPYQAQYVYTIFELMGELWMIADDAFYGYKWNGSSWDSAPEIAIGINAVTSRANMDTFILDGDLCLIIGSSGTDLFGFRYII